MIDVQHCPVCDSEQLLPNIACTDHSVSRENFSIRKCLKCTLLITTPRPSDNEMPKYYSSPAYTSHAKTAKTIVERAYFFARNFTLKWKLSLIDQSVSLSNGKKILDYGSGTGEFLKVAQLHGWEPTGMEPAQGPRLQAPASLNIKSTLSEIINEKKQFDAITLWHVLEHVTDLNSTLHELKTLLSSVGTMFIAVPNHTSWDATYYGENWAAYDVPRHLWHFNETAMRTLLDKHALKLVKIIPMRLDAYYISLLSEQYKANGRTVSGALIALLNGFRSNFHARKTMQYSSQIYVVKK